jgi:hypothetical protein
MEIPDNIKESLQRYVDKGIPTGSFLQAVLENNLMGAVGKADYINKHLLPEICSYIYNQLPSISHGSPENVQKWIERGGLNK